MKKLLIILLLLSSCTAYKTDNFVLKGTVSKVFPAKHGFATAVIDTKTRVNYIPPQSIKYFKPGNDVTVLVQRQFTTKKKQLNNQPKFYFFREVIKPKNNRND